MKILKNNVKKKVVEIKEIINFWEQVKESLDLKGKFIRFQEHDDPREDTFMHVEYCNIKFNNSEEIEYSIHGTMLDNYNSSGPNFSLNLNTTRTLYFSLKDLLENKSDVSNIREVTREDFLSIIDYKIDCYKQILDLNG